MVVKLRLTGWMARAARTVASGRTSDLMDALICVMGLIWVLALVMTFAVQGVN